jgi:hypothetical protein
MRGQVKHEIRPLAWQVAVDEHELRVELADGRQIVVPLARFPRLVAASAASRAHWQSLGDGEGIHWPDVDEDISVADLLADEK